jgi:CheY-like chemotaxis protein
MLKSVLSMRGYTILAAATPADGLQLAGTQHIDAILVDYDMPGMNGLDFCRKLREQESAAGRDTPTWIMTGALHTEVGKEAENAGALFVLRKPLSADDVCARIEEELLRRSGG